MRSMTTILLSLVVLAALVIESQATGGGQEQQQPAKKLDLDQRIPEKPCKHENEACDVVKKDCCTTTVASEKLSCMPHKDGGHQCFKAS